MTSMILPSYNYGGFVDLEDSRDEYEMLDKQFLGALQSIIDIRIDMKFLVAPRDKGGLQLLMVSPFFNAMQKVMLYDDTGDGFKQYHLLRKELLAGFKDPIQQSQAHHLLLHWRALSDPQID